MVELKFGDFGFCDGGKSGEPGEKPSDRRESTTNSPNKAQDQNRTPATLVRNESALTTAPSVLYNYIEIDLKQYKPLVWAVSIINSKITPFLNIVLLEALTPAGYI